MRYALTTHAPRYHRDSVNLSLVIAAALLWGLSSLVFASNMRGLHGLNVIHNDVVVEAKNSASIGDATSGLIAKLETEGYDLEVIDTGNRAFFSVPGVIVSLAKDNIQIFEYEDRLMSNIEITAFKKHAGTTQGSWKKRVHLYTDGNLVVFYMGEKSGVLSILENVLGQEVSPRTT